MEAPVFFLAMTAMLCGTFIVVSIARMVANRGKGKLLSNRGLAQLDERLTRMEQAIDAMAIEMERVSEGQRFTTKLLSERSREPVS